jgi:hypothetical protein
MDALRALAAENRWPAIRELLAGPSYRALYDQAALVFEEMGDERATAGEWGAALRCFHFGLWRAMQKPGSKGLVTGAAGMTAMQLHLKFSNALQQVRKRAVAFRESCAAEIHELVDASRFVDAEEMLGWLGSLRNRETTAWCAQRAAEIHAARFPSKPYVPPPPPAPPQEPVPHKLTAAEREAVHQEYLRKLRAHVEQQLADPLQDLTAPEPLEWESGRKHVELMALAGRFNEAGKLFRRVSALPDQGYRLIANAHRFEEIADHVAASQPEIARWFYEIVVEEYANFASSSDTAYEGNERWGWHSSAKAKLEGVSRATGAK